jgi:hypothetical protein
VISSPPRVFPREGKEVLPAVTAAPKPAVTTSSSVQAPASSAQAAATVQSPVDPATAPAATAGHGRGRANHGDDAPVPVAPPPDEQVAPAEPAASHGDEPPASQGDEEHGRATAPGQQDKSPKPDKGAPLK